MSAPALFLQVWTGARNLVRPAPQQVALIAGGPNAPELACRPLDYQGHHHPRRAYAEVKADGIRCLFVEGRLVTLEGQPMNCALHCRDALVRLEQRYGEAMMFDGEYVEDGGFDATVTAFKKGEGAGTLWLFDAVPMREWVRDTSREPWHLRKAVLLDHIRRLDSPWVGGLLGRAVPTEADARAMFEEMRALGYEGIVVKDAEATYSRARCNQWQRLKPFESIDLKILDVLGDDQRGCRKIICRDQAGPVTLTSGWNKDQAKALWRQRNHVVGVLAEVNHCGRTQQGRLRHARFSKLRDDRPRSITVQLPRR